MTDLDARVAALMALEYISWHAFGECRIGLGPIPEARDVVAAIRAELQKPALHEPVTGKELQAFLDASGLSYFDLAKVEDGLESFLQGRAKPATTGPDDIYAEDKAVDSFAERMKCKLAKARERGKYGWQDKNWTPEQISQALREHVDKGDPVDVANYCMFLAARNEPITEYPAQEEITDAETMAQTRYHVDKADNGFWPYVVRCGTGTQVLYKGHLKSCMNVAQILTGAFLDGAFVVSRAIKGEKTSYPSFAEMFQPPINTPIKFTTTQSIQRDAELHGILGYFDGTKYWSKDGADHWSIHEITNWKAIKS